MSLQPSAISVLIKPVGPDCNLRCTYCFYRQKAGMFPDAREHRMKESTLKQLVVQALGAGTDVAIFSWQGGEPTLAGLDFYRRVVQLQAEHAHPGQVVSNALQTNATLLDRKWAEFLREHNFLVGVSVDGPAGLHDHYRCDAGKVGTHERVAANLRMLVEAGAEVNILTLLNDRNVREPDRVYDFMLETGVRHFQFVACVEPGAGGRPASYSISPDAYGDFLCRLFDRWMDGPMDVSIRDFDDLLAWYRGEPPGTCMFQPLCGGYALVEHNGDVFPCDFFVVPKWRLGNLHEIPLVELMRSPKMKEFGEQKALLSDVCRACTWLTFCYGGCLKHRTVLGGNVSDRTYFCAAYKRLLEHASSVLAELQGSR